MPWANAPDAAVLSVRRESDAVDARRSPFVDPKRLPWETNWKARPIHRTTIYCARGREGKLMAQWILTVTLLGQIVIGNLILDRRYDDLLRKITELERNDNGQKGAFL